MVIAVGLCRGDHLEPLGGRAGAEGVEELLCRGVPGGICSCSASAATPWEGKVKPGPGNSCFIQTKDLFTEKIPTYPEFQ